MQGLADLGAEFGGLAKGQPLVDQPFRKGEALDEIVHDVGDPFLQAHLVNADDARVLELRGCSGLAQELLRVVETQLSFPRHLQGHDAIELGVAGFPDHAERAHAQPLHQLEVPHRLRATPCRAVGREVGGLTSGQSEGLPTGRARDPIQRIIVSDLQPMMAVRTAHAQRGSPGRRDAGSGRRTVRFVSTVGEYERLVDLLGVAGETYDVLAAGWLLGLRPPPLEFQGQQLADQHLALRLRNVVQMVLDPGSRPGMPSGLKPRAGGVHPERPGSRPRVGSYRVHR
jgi:hypothetical protein